MYKYIKKEGNFPLFSFETKHGLCYFVAFRKMDLGIDFFNNLYSIDFWEASKSKFQKDKEIQITIIRIIKDYFSENPYTMLHFVCDNMDFRHLYRQKLFDKWYDKYATAEFEKLNSQYIIPEKDIDYKFGFIFKTDFYNSTKVSEIVNTQLDEFTSYK